MDFAKSKGKIMKVLMLCGTHGNQKALAHRVSNSIEIDEIIVVTGNVKQGFSFRKYLCTMKQKFGAILTGFLYRKVWFGMLRHYEEMYTKFPIRPSLS